MYERLHAGVNEGVRESVRERVCEGWIRHHLYMRGE